MNSFHINAQYKLNAVEQHEYSMNNLESREGFLTPCKGGEEGAKNESHLKIVGEVKICWNPIKSTEKWQLNFSQEI